MVATEHIPPGESETEQIEMPAPATQATVLLVDDDPRNLFALESVLEGGDYTINEGSNRKRGAACANETGVRCDCARCSDAGSQWHSSSPA